MALAWIQDSQYGNLYSNAWQLKSRCEAISAPEASKCMEGLLYAWGVVEQHHRKYEESLDDCKNILLIDQQQAIIDKQQAIITFLKRVSTVFILGTFISNTQQV